MRNRLKLIITAALVSALAVAGLSIAAGGGDGGGQSTSASPAAPGSFVANGDRTRGRALRGDLADEDVRAVLDDIREAVAKQAVDIAGPVIDKAEQDNKITEAQADRLRQAAQDIQDGKRPNLRALGRDRDVHEVVHDAFAAAAKKAQEIGEPIIDKAVSDNKITEAQADRIRELLKRAPRGPGPGFKPHGPGRGFGPGGAAFRDADVRDVLQDVHKALAAQADDIAKPIIDKAEDDGKITAVQADELRDAAEGLADGKRGGPPLRGLSMRDEDVHEVLHDVFAAVAKKAPGIAKPIIDKAVADDKITAAQARQIRSMIEHKGERRGLGRGHKPPRFERPGGPGGFGPGGPPPPGDSAAPETQSAPGTTS